MSSSLPDGPRLALVATVLDTPTPRSLARFYQRLLGWEIGTDDDDWVTLRPRGGCGRGLSFQREDRYVPPVWPASQGSGQGAGQGREQQMMAHLDIAVADLDDAVTHALACGASLADYQPQDDVRVCLDPDGHPFCLFLQTPFPDDLV